MSSIRLIVSDIDGTILDQQHQVDPDLIELIPKLQEKRFLLSCIGSFSYRDCSYRKKIGRPSGTNRLLQWSSHRQGRRDSIEHSLKQR